jgi:ABC-type sugar transport system ATPase subunit
MADIRLENLVKRFGRQTAVDGLDLHVKDREFVALLGPSGCGKTTTMNMISGLLRPDSGTVYFDGRPMNHVPPEQRGVGFVFQNYAVFTHMTVYENISFGLRIKKMDPGVIEREVREVARLLQIRHLLGMKASRLSINDMQKVALARSMITRPRIFLLDEPLSNLDAALRTIMRAELKKIQQELGQTSVYVTHDQVEAMSLADRIAVMNYAVLQQYDTPHNIYNRPRNMFVANFIGSPTINFLNGVYRSGEFVLEDFRRGTVTVSGANRTRLEGLLKGEKVVVGVRPEHVKLADDDRPARAGGEVREGAAAGGDRAAGRAGDGGLRATVASFEPLGSKTIVYLHPDANPGLILKSAMPSGYKPKIGEVKRLQFSERSLYLFDRESTELVMRFA